MLGTVLVSHSRVEMNGEQLGGIVLIFLVVLILSSLTIDLPRIRIQDSIRREGRKADYIRFKVRLMNISFVLKVVMDEYL